MRRRDVAIAALACLLTGAAGTAIGASRRAAGDASPAGDEVSALRERVADLERQVASLRERPAAMPGLSAAPETPPTKSQNPQTAQAGVEAAPAPGERLPSESVSLMRLLNGSELLPATVGRASLDPKAAELLTLAQRDPEAAARATRDLWERGTKAERETAVEVLTRTSHRAFRDLLSDALSTTPPPERAAELIRRAAEAKGSAWFPVQMTGAPDAPIAGDHAAAWASLKEDMGEVVVDLDYAVPVRVDGVRVHETFNPGAVARVYAKDPRGGWDLLWEGRAATDAPNRWFEPPVSTSYATTSIRLVLDTDRVAGWNEIDAVELLGDGHRQWASGASASSTFGTEQ